MGNRLNSMTHKSQIHTFFITYFEEQLNYIKNEKKTTICTTSNHVLFNGKSTSTNHN